MITRKKGAEAALAKIANKRATERGAAPKRSETMPAIAPEDRKSVVAEIIAYFKRNLSAGEASICNDPKTFPGVRMHFLLSTLWDPNTYVSARDARGYQMTASRDGIVVNHARGEETIAWDELLDSLEAAVERGKETLNAEGAEVAEKTAAVVNKARAKGKVKADAASNASEPPAAAAAATATAGSAAPGGAFAVQIDARLISPNPYQPRHDFDKASLEETVASLKANGQLQSILVRPDPTHEGRYQIADGERRWRAAKLAGIQLTAMVRELSDEQMARLALEANLRRKDLNAVEEARQFQLLIEKFGYTQKRIGEEFSIADSQVCNRIRLLQLPEAWLKRVISGELPATHARSLSRYGKYPAILKEMEFQLEGGVTSISVWDEELQSAAWCESKPLKGTVHIHDRGHVALAFKPTPEQLDELDVIELTRYSGGGKQKRALNVALWDKLQAAGEKAKTEREAKAEAKRAASGKPAKAVAKTKPSPDRGHVDRRWYPPADILKRRLTEWRIRWFSYLVERSLAKPVAKGTPPRALAAPLRVVLYMATRAGADFHGMNEALRSVAKARGLDARSSWMGLDAWKVLGAEDPTRLADLSVDVVRACLFREKEGPIATCLSPDVIEGLVDDLGIDLGAQWRAELAGPLTDEFFNHHTRDQLAGLAKHWGIDIGEAKTTKVATVEAIRADAATRQKLPPSLLPKKAQKATGNRPQASGKKKAARA